MYIRSDLGRWDKDGRNKGAIYSVKLHHWVTLEVR